MPITFIVRMRFAPEDRLLVADLLRKLAEASRDEAGCIAYVPCHVEGDRDHILIWEQYRDEAAVEVHRSSQHFQDWATEGLYRRMRERSLEKLNPIA